MSDPGNFSEVFLQEAGELLSDIEESILDIEGDPTNQDAINRLFRSMHTIKGSGAMFGFDDIADFTHHVETSLDHVREGRIEISRELIDLILASKDHIKSMLNHAAGGPKANKKIGREIIKKFKELTPDEEKIEVSNEEEIVDSTSFDENKEENEFSYRIAFKPDKDIFATGMDPSLLIEELRALGSCTVVVKADSVPTLNNLVPEHCYLKWDIVLVTQEDINAVKDVFIFVEDSAELEIKDITIKDSNEVPRIGEILVDRGVATKEQIELAVSKQDRIGDLLCKTAGVSESEIKSALAEQKSFENRKTAALKESVRVPSDKLDKLINLVGELVITQAQLTRVAASVDAHELATPVEEVDRLTGELRDIALGIRMMPIGSTFSRFRRLVRDLSAELGKEIDLVTEGAETELDKTVLDRMADPLVHLIRNSIDHGIEKPEIREENNKPTKGIIRLSAKHVGARVVISIEDDGAGIDAEIIKNIAIEREIIAPDADLSEKEIFSLIMAPGFSTAQIVSSVSGRGVGMDVVKREIESLRGSIDISSQQGLGTTIALSLPLTLAIIDGLLVEVSENKYVIPVNSIEECLELSESNHAMDKQRNLLQVRGELVPFIRLREAFEIGGSSPGDEEAVIVEVGDSRVGVVVDHVIGDHQTVIKSLGKLYKDVQGVSGATIMGDGKVALILDMLSLMTIADFEEQTHIFGQNDHENEGVVVQ